jgi:predicted nucleotidyltransferase
MDVTNEKSEETPLLTHGDLAIAAYAISQCFNAYLESYEAENYTEEMTKSDMEKSMNSLQLTFNKFDALVRTLQMQQEQKEAGENASEAPETTEE